MSGPAQRLTLYVHPDAWSVAAGWRSLFEVREAATAPTDADFHLWAVDDHLELRRGAERRGVWVPAVELRRRAGHNTELVRACGLVGSAAARGTPRVLDVMAGYGLDGLALAARGCAVTLIERHAAIHALQCDLVRRVGAPHVCCRLGDGFEYLSEQHPFDLVYLDPMFPERSKGALPGKRMQYLAELGVADLRGLDRWIERARGCAIGRVVLKRRLREPVVGQPDWQIRGTSVRYDLYRGRAAVSAPDAPRSGTPDR